MEKWYDDYAKARRNTYTRDRWKVSMKDYRIGGASAQSKGRGKRCSHGTQRDGNGGRKEKEAWPEIGVSA